MAGGTAGGAGFDSWDDVAAWLRKRRSEQGSPSFAILAGRIGRLRTARGEPSTVPGRVTVYDCFRAGRRRMDPDLLLDLAAVLGLEGADLRDFGAACFGVQNLIDASLVVSVREAAPEARPFVGRTAERDTLTGSPGVFVLSGLPGVGKTALALRAAHDLVAAGRADTVLVVDLRAFHPTRPSADGTAALQEVARVVTGDPAAGHAPPDRLRAHLARELAARRCVLVLDDAADRTQVRAMLVDGDVDPATVVVTSRRSLALEDATAIALGPLGSADGVALLAGAGGAAVAKDPGEAARIVELLGGLPLAVEVTGRRVAARTDWSLAEHRSALERQAALLRLPEGLHATFDLSYAGLAPASAQLLRLVADLPCPTLGVGDLAALGGVADRSAAAALEELTAAHLVTRAGDRLSLHDVVRVHARARSLEDDAPGDLQAARGRLLDRLLRGLVAAVVASGLRPLLGPAWFDPADADPGSPGADAAQAWLAEQRETLLALADPAESGVRPEFLVRVAAALSRVNDVRGLTADSHLLGARLIAEGQRARSAPVEALGQWLAGSALVRLGSLEDARGHLERALRLVNVPSDPDLYAGARNAQAVLDVIAGDFAAARQGFEDVLAVVETQATVRTPPTILGNLGTVQVRLGNLSAAAALHRRAAAGAEAEGDQETLGVALSNLSDVLMMEGDARGAQRAAERARDLAEALGSLVALGGAWSNLGSALAAQGRFEEAADAHHEALVVVARSGERAQEASILNDLGDTQRLAGELTAAATTYARAAEVADAVGSPREQTRAAAGLAALG